MFFTISEAGHKDTHSKLGKPPPDITAGILAPLCCSEYQQFELPKGVGPAEQRASAALNWEALVRHNSFI